MCRMRQPYDNQKMHCLHTANYIKKICFYTAVGTILMLFLVKIDLQFEPEPRNVTQCGLGIAVNQYNCGGIFWC